MTMLYGQSMVMFCLQETYWPCCMLNAWSSLACFTMWLWLCQHDLKHYLTTIKGEKLKITSKLTLVSFLKYKKIIQILWPCFMDKAWSCFIFMKHWYWPCCMVKAWSSLASVLHLWLLIMSAWFNTLFNNHNIWKTKLITSKLPGFNFLQLFWYKKFIQRLWPCFMDKAWSWCFIFMKHIDHAALSKHGHPLLQFYICDFWLCQHDLMHYLTTTKCEKLN